MSRLESEAVALIRAQRWAALATAGAGGPMASMVAYAPEPGLAGVLMFLSGLSAHTANLLADRRAALMVSVPDPGSGDPQTLPRISLQGEVELIGRTAGEFPAAWQHYADRFPGAVSRLGLADFDLFRLVVEEARYVGGFARARTIPGDRLREAARKQPGG